MINSETVVPSPEEPHDAKLDIILRSGMPGAVVLAGIATAVVIGLWIAFYVLVFMSRGPTS
jgi:hypothetical protein